MAALLSLVRSGEVERIDLELAAALGDPVARLASANLQPVTLLIHFWAEWNGWDRQLEPLVDAALAAARGEVLFHRWDIDTPGTGEAQAAMGVASNFRVVADTTLIAFRAGREVGRHYGLIRTEEWLARTLAGASQ